jgi:hypothetical protein
MLSKEKSFLSPFLVSFPENRLCSKILVENRTWIKIDFSETSFYETMRLDNMRGKIVA